MRINLKNPERLVNFVDRSLTSWKIEYIGQGTKNGIYYYSLTDRTNMGIKVNVEIDSQTQEMYNPDDFSRNQWVKIYCKDINVAQKRGCTKFLRVADFKDIRRVFNTISDGGRQVLQ
jgi:hypothetical protein